MNLKKIFNNCRIVGLAGEKNTGKTNNLISLIKEFREKNKEVEIYAYGMPTEAMNYLSKLKVIEISELSHLTRKKNCIFIIDEFQKLKLNDRRNREELSSFVDFIYHNNNYTILASPNLREFNSVIGGVIERWLLKNVRLDLCVNGSQLKKVIEKYKGRHKELGAIEVPVSQLLLINEQQEILLDCEYVRQADTKKNLVKLF